AQNAVPAPVMSKAPTLESSPHCLIMRRSAGVNRSDKALRASGRFNVMSATPSRISHSNSPVPVSTSIRSSAICAASVAHSRDFQGFLIVGVEEARKPAPDQPLGIRHDAVDQFLHRRNVVNESNDHAAAPRTSVHIAVDHHLGIDARYLFVDVVDLQAFALLALDLEQVLDTLVVQ